MSGKRLAATPPGVTLGLLEEIGDGQARNYVVQIGEDRFHGFVVRRGVAVWGYLDRCPHVGAPLAKVLDDYLTPDGRFIACSWHGALFGVADGQCVGGPCVGQRLTRWPVLIEDGWIKTGPAAPA